MGTEWTSEQYDEFYRVSDEYQAHYGASIYWPMWQEVLKRIPKNAVVLEFGCGTGQFAKALFDRGCNGYGGIDFSEVALEIARKNVSTPGVFVQCDIRKVVVTSDYDYLVCLETLEHIEDDVAVLNRIRPGKRCLITVPSYTGPNHIRSFSSYEQVLARYSMFFDTVPKQKLLTRIPFGEENIWLIYGVRNESCGD